MSQCLFLWPWCDAIVLGCNDAIEAHGHRTLPINDQRHIKVHDIKLWERDEVRAHVAKGDKYHCPRKICPSACPLKRSTIVKHLQDFGCHQCKRGWTKVCPSN